MMQSDIAVYMVIAAVFYLGGMVVGALLIGWLVGLLTIERGKHDADDG